MYKVDYENIKSPLIYIFGMFILAPVFYYIFYKYSLLAIILASSFFILIYFYKGNLAVIVSIIFFLIGIFNNYNYYNFKPHKETTIVVKRISFYGGEGEIDGRKVYLRGDLKGIKKGEKILSSGEFNKEIIRDKGIVGSYDVKEYKKIHGGITEKLYDTREKIFLKIKDKIGTRRASIITSMAFGYTDFLENDDKVEMKNLGVMHAVAVSGLHMALLYTLLKKIFGDKITPIVAFIYVVFTGAALSTIRAYIMLICMNMAIPLRRNYSPLSALALSGILILLFKPYSIFEVGFQLSFLATLGIIVFNKRINKKLYKLPKYFREGISISISTQIFTFPILVLTFQEFSVSFLLGNLILSPIISLIVALGNLIVVFSSIDIIFNYLCFIAYYITRLMDLTIDILRCITPELVYLNEGVATVYLSILLGGYYYKKGFKKMIYIPFIMVIYISLCIYSPFIKMKYYREGAIVVSFKGERIVVQTKKTLNIEKIKNTTLATKIYKDIKALKIKGDVSLDFLDKDIILNNKGRKFLIVVSGDKRTSEYDIINFNEGTFSEIIILYKKVLKLD